MTTTTSPNISRVFLRSPLMILFLILIPGFLFLNFFTYGVAMVISSIGYSAYLTVFRAEFAHLRYYYAEKQTFIQIHSQYEYSKKILYITIPSIIIITILTQSQPVEVQSIPSMVSNPSLIFTPTPISVPIIINQSLLALTAVAPLYLYYYGLVRIALMKDGYLFASNWMQFMSEEKDPVQKIRYFYIGLNHYNAYLKREFNFRIN